MSSGEVNFISVQIDRSEISCKRARKVFAATCGVLFIRTFFLSLKSSC